ncbi:Gag-Pol polyprotein [Gossypium australe]|uniref:Gag-Pol polyprotein n=1 Tax=Gossypium australe TaxID=47621 RepID=A0A5B6UW94_9ROSI|nr:Gag-Pol polyprotein [Gossypium australe]
MVEYFGVCGTKRKSYLGTEFQKIYISQRFLDQKYNEFLELKQGQMTVTEYKREFVLLSKYAREYVSTEEIMCKQFVDRLNEYIKLLVGILELKEFVVLVDRACKAEELSKEKRKADSEARDSRKRSMSKPYHSSSKESRDYFNRSTTPAGYSNRDHGEQCTSPKAQATSVSSVGNVKNNKPKCQQCGRWHLEIVGCVSRDHFIGDCLELAEKDEFQNARLSNITNRGKPSRNARNVTSNRGVTKHLANESEARAPIRAYTIRACEDASPPDVITCTFSLYGSNVIALIDPGSTHSYLCKNLVSSKKLPVESTEFVIKVSNPLGKYVLVNKVCKNCPLMTQGYSFLADLMLFPFDEFDVILGMDWLTLHNAVVNCRRKTIELKCQNSEIIRIKSDELVNCL